MDLREIMLKRELQYSKYATLDEHAIRLGKFTPDFRPHFSLDTDRIIHSASYTRYMDKTQVFSFANNDHISKRMMHVQIVSKAARTIGRALSLNEDLIEAIALGHDLGHVPFGHLGESILDEISQNHGEGNFLHNVQSVRNLMVIENKNLTVQVLDGILCHNGELVNNKYQPRKKSVKDFLTDYEQSYKNKTHTTKLTPMTLEGCVVRISDVIGYLGRDIEDAVELGVLNIKDIPKDIVKIMGQSNKIISNKSIINNIVLDIIKNSLNKPYIKLSDDMFNAIIKLKKFNYDHIYHKANTEASINDCKLMFNKVFDVLLLILENNDQKQNIYKNFLNKMDNEYLQNTSNARKIIDYIAGMTDDYFINEYNNLKNITNLN